MACWPAVTPTPHYHHNSLTGLNLLGSKSQLYHESLLPCVIDATNFSVHMVSKKNIKIWSEKRTIRTMPNEEHEDASCCCCCCCCCGYTNGMARVIHTLPPPFHDSKEDNVTRPEVVDEKSEPWDGSRASAHPRVLSSHGREISIVGLVSSS